MHARFLSFIRLIFALVELMLHFGDASWNTCTLLFEYCTQIYPSELPAFKRMADAYGTDKKKLSELMFCGEWIKRVSKRTYTQQEPKMKKEMIRSLLELVHTFDTFGSEYVCSVFSSGRFQALFTFYNTFSSKISERCLKTFMQRARIPRT